MRQAPQPRQHRQAFVRRRFGLLLILALIGLAAACWFNWQRSQPPPPSLRRLTSPQNRPTTSALPSQAPVPTLLSSPVSINSRGADRIAATGTDRPPIPTVTNSAVRPPATTVSNTSATLPNAHTAIGLPPLDPILLTQIALANRGISAGPIDGVMGRQTRAALAAFQQQQGLADSGQLDAPTRAILSTNIASFTLYNITATDLANLAPVPDTWLGKSLAARLGHSSIVELLAEKGWASQHLVRRLNPNIAWDTIAPGTEVRLPQVRPPQFRGKASRVRIFLSRRLLQAFDEQDRLLVHFPCSIAQRVEKRPVGELRVSVVVPEPDYTFNPETFPESEEGRQLGRRLRIPPGPNNPVGLAWIGLDRPGYGIHGSPDPEKIGRTESHGCFRLANWNAAMLLELAWEGLPVSVLP